ncbi:MAG: type II CAAX prenyl endopeptidase Rce1 family protein [Myxococcota bacterium]
MTADLQGDPPAPPAPEPGPPEPAGAAPVPTWRRRLRELHPRRFFLETWRQMDAEAAAERAARKLAGAGYDFRPAVALCLGAVLLTLMEYFGVSITFHRVAKVLEDRSEGSLWWLLRRSRWSELFGYAWWSGCRVAGYFVLPALFVKLMGGRVRDQGLATRGFLAHAWIYVLAYLVVLGLVVAVSFTDEFSRYYPFYGKANRSWFDLVAWELLYAAQFFGLEFFFRGWWLQQLKPMMGSHAIFAMVVPYCMIHFGKPWMEALAAVVAGVVLGTLAMKTRSIWSGFLIHVSVAVSMDVAALVQTGGLPTRAWPG